MSYFQPAIQTQAAWDADTEVYQQFTIMFVLDGPNKGKFKLSDGVNPFSSLSYFTTGGGSTDWGDIGGTITDQADLVAALAALEQTQDVQDALDGANAPDASNVFATMNDLSYYANNTIQGFVSISGLYAGTWLFEPNVGGDRYAQSPGSTTFITANAGGHAWGMYVSGSLTYYTEEASMNTSEWFSEADDTPVVISTELYDGTVEDSLHELAENKANTRRLRAQVYLNDQSYSLTGQEDTILAIGADPVMVNETVGSFTPNAGFRFTMKNTMTQNYNMTFTPDANVDGQGSYVVGPGCSASFEKQSDGDWSVVSFSLSGSVGRIYLNGVLQPANSTVDTIYVDVTESGGHLNVYVDDTFDGNGTPLFSTVLSASAVCMASAGSAVSRQFAQAPDLSTNPIVFDVSQGVVAASVGDPTLLAADQGWIFRVEIKGIRA